MTVRVTSVCTNVLRWGDRKSTGETIQMRYEFTWGLLMLLGAVVALLLAAAFVSGGAGLAVGVASLLLAIASFALALRRPSGGGWKF